MKPLVSVIIPVYNSENFILETINSVLNQTYPFIEIILVDDGSTDNTIAYFSKFEELGVKCFSVENGGASRARNYGLKQAKGEYIQFLDADDLIHKDKISIQVEEMTKENSDLSFAPWINFKDTIGDLNTIFKYNKVLTKDLTTGKNILLSFGMNNWYIPTVAWLVKTDLINKTGFWNEGITNNDDGEFFTRVLLNSEKISFNNKILGYYRVQENDSLSKKNSKEKVDSAYNSYKLIEKHILDCDDLRLLAYPKRLYYVHYNMIKYNFPKEAKRAAIAFDNLKVDCFLNEDEYYSKMISLFGLHRIKLFERGYKKAKQSIFK